MTSEPAGPDETPAGRLRPVLRTLLGGAVVAAVAGAFWAVRGRDLWDDRRATQRAIRAAEDAAPIGYLNIVFRNTYVDRPREFHAERDGRRLLWAAGGGSGPAEWFDVTGATFDVRAVNGGLGRDSVPGIDAPVFEPPTALRARRMPAHLPCLGAPLATGPRAYPLPLLAKVQVVNDRDGPIPFVVAFDGRRARPYDRVLRGRPVTFGTSGYDLLGRPVLYDRRTRSLWLPDADALSCVAGPSQGARLRALAPFAETTWGRWTSRHPDTRVLVGSALGLHDPLPAE